MGMSWYAAFTRLSKNGHVKGDKTYGIYSTHGSTDKCVLVGKHEGRRDLKDGSIMLIKMDNNEIGWEGFECIHMAYDQDQ
jgi:hypothetical protein